MSPNLKTKSVGAGSPCGCGGSMASPAAPCKCGGAGCDSCDAQGRFIRPRFFAGQLLTEEDLQLLDTYVVSKNRLHNRFLFGDGVVCGLEVTCHPCGDGSVVVHPGYALDCCGNDLMVACATTLDINAMVRDLRRRLLGVDCGDPCADDQEPTKKDDEESDNKFQSAASSDEAATQKPMGAARHYCLYVRYCETMTDPVSPYSTGDPCGAQACEPTRVREGVRFELRCREEENARNDLFTRICQCLGDMDSVEKSSSDALWFRVFGSRTETALTEIKAHMVPSFEQSHVEAMVLATKALADANKLLGAAGSAATRDLLASGATTEVSEAALRTALDTTLETASLVARFYSRNAKEQGELVKKFEGLGGKVRSAEAELTSTVEIFSAPANAQLINATLSSTLERESAAALLEIVDGKLLPEGKPLIDDPEVRLLAEGAVFNARIMRASVSALDALREWALDRLDKSPYLTDCELRLEIAKVLTPPDTPGKIGFSDALAFSRASHRLGKIFIRLLRDCVCLALNPSCAPCDDTAVLLACLEIKDCDVIRICNIDRKFVLSPSAVRYWFPQIGLLGEEFEKFCCPEDKAEYVEKSERWPRTALATRSIGLSGFAPTALSILTGSLSRICGADAKQFGRVSKWILALFREPGVGFVRPMPFLRLSPTGVTEVSRENAKASVAPSFDLSGDLGSVMDRIASLVDSRVEAKLAARFEGREPAAPRKRKSSKSPKEGR